MGFCLRVYHLSLKLYGLTFFSGKPSELHSLSSYKLYVSEFGIGGNIVFRGVLKGYRLLFLLAVGLQVQSKITDSL